MLKVESIEFINKKEEEDIIYLINRNQIESFPLLGGESATTITTKVWNQHGETYIDSFMEVFQGELIFALITKNKTPKEIELARREIIEMCNPLNGTIVMKVNLNSGSSYNRDVNFVNTPIFPNGFENRNEAWQKVQLTFEANNPFWYEDIEILEDFQNVEPLFEFPFDMAATTDEITFGNVIPENVVNNTGQVEAPVIIKVYGACTNPRIDNLTTHEFIAFKNLTMTANSELTINTAFGQKSIDLDGENVFNKLDFDSTFFNLDKGINDISFSAATGTPIFHFIYRNLYITI